MDKNQEKMNRTVLFLLSIILIASACDGPQKAKETETDSLKESILKQEKKVYNSGQNRLQEQDALVLVGLYENFAAENPADSLTPEYLFRASDLSMNLRRPMRTIQLFDHILTEYPDFNKAPAALFLKAFVYEDQLQDYGNAKQYYELFLVKYPNSEFADDAEISLKNLGKTPEELIQEFESK